MDIKLRNIPIFGRRLKKIYNKFMKVAPFQTSNQYWEDRYAHGGNSGRGSYKNLAEFKGRIINEFIMKNSIESVIEFGSGDGNQLKYFNIKNYLGFDVSKTVVENCNNIYLNDSSKIFKMLDSYDGEIADLAMSLDVIYHLVEDDVYLEHMSQLFNASKVFVIIYSSNSDKHENIHASDHVRHRKFTAWIEANAPHYTLIQHILNEFPFNKSDFLYSSYADFYMYKIE